jgi:hypothetical protein
LLGILVCWERYIFLLNIGGNFLLKRFLKVLIYVFILPLLIILISILLNIPKSFINIIVTLVVTYIYIGVLALIFNIRPKKYKRRKSIYDWMDELPDHDEKLTHVLMKQDNKYSTIDNLKIIKKNIYKQTNSNLETLKLYRTFYRQLLKENSDDLYLKSALSFFIPFSLYILKDYQIGISEVSINSRYLSIILIFITIAFIANKLTVNQKRYGLTIEILDLCIEELEYKEKNESKGESI